jgi:hypothetical protein
VGAKNSAEKCVYTGKYVEGIEMIGRNWMVVAGWSGFALGSAGAWGQMHKVEKPDSVVRAVAVYEWTGEEGKPTASRIVPISLYIDGQFQDAAIYLARPVPMALDTGTVYEVRKAGIDAGTLELAYERHYTGGDSDNGTEIDDGWMGYGPFKLKPKPTYESKKQSGPLPQVAVNGNAPHFGGKAATSNTGASTEDSDRPSFHTRAPASTDSSASASSNPSSGSSDTDSENDADRPTLKRRSPAEMKTAQKKKDSARVIAGNDLNDDPDRPTLHRGSTTETDEQENPPLRGLPKDMHQLVAVSDAKDRPEHDFARPWESADEQIEVLGKMQAFAREQLASYKGVGPAPVAAPVPVAPAASASRLKKKAAPAPVPPPAPLPLNDEVLKGYTLSYGGAPTYVYMATSPGANGVSRYVTVVAQEDTVTGLKLALSNVTDSLHLDRTPWMRPVDVVDADASNRASVLMELRAAHTRQFALYRVIGATADQVFLTGSTE